MLFKMDVDVVTYHKQIACMEQKIDDMTIQYRENMFTRIQEGTGTDEESILLSEMFTDFERIGDHILNISDEIMKIALKEYA
jgi:phosphate:Na+ symporter